MTKKTQIILLIIFAILLLALPFILNNEINTKIGIGINLISGISSIATLIIALVLFNKFGIENSLLDKQTNEVFELLEELNKPLIIMQGKSAFLKINPAKPYDKHYERFYGYNLIFSSNYMAGLKIISNYGNKIFVPKPIADKIKALDIYMLTSLRKDNVINENEFLVTIKNNEYEDESSGKPNGKEMNFMEFTTLWNELLEEIKNWIKVNSSREAELNLN
jgi:hypothetical protein